MNLIFPKGRSLLYTQNWNYDCNNHNLTVFRCDWWCGYEGRN